MDMEWAHNGDTGELFIVQARPETVQSRIDAGAIKSYTVKKAGKPLLKGLSVGSAVATGRVSIIESAHEIDQFVNGSILVTGTTDPDWVPIMKRASAIVTDHAGRTCHAAIVSRELGLPAIIGTGNASHIRHDEQEVTVSGTGGDEGAITEGIADFSSETLRFDNLPDTKTKVMLNLANPSAAFRWWRRPFDGVGLARLEFVVNNALKVHPMALVHFDSLKDETAKAQIAELARAFPDKTEYFIDGLARGLPQIAAVA